MLAALRNLEQGDGAGQVVDVALFESIYATLASEAVKFQAAGKTSRRMGNQAVNTAPRNIYACADGEYLALSASLQTMFERLAETIEQPELIHDARFATNEDRVRNNDALNGILADYFGARTLADNPAVMERAGVTVAPVLSAGDLVDHPYAAGRGLFVQTADAELGSCPVPAPVPRLSRTPGCVSRPAPRLGEHTDEVLALAMRASA